MSAAIENVIAANQAVTPAGARAAESEPDSSSYGQILHSSLLIGGASAIGLLMSLIRTKAMAVLLGPAGFGLMGALTAISDLARSIAAVGINSSGVRQIAESAATGDAERVARTAFVLRRVAVVLGLLGAVLLAVSSPLVSHVTFGDGGYTGAVAVLSLAVLFRLISDGQGALLQGLRRITDMARISVYGSALSVVVAVALVYWLREDGVAPAIVAIAAVSLLVSWWYSRKVQVLPVQMSLPEMKTETAALLRLGFAFMASGVLMMGAAYVVRLFIIRHEGLDAAGLYQSAWTIGGLYVGFILQAMGADFYPRLVGATEDHPTCNRLVNEQAQVSLLLAGSGVVATVALAPYVLMLLYSPAFAPAAETLRWICLGMALRVVTWPIGFIIVAKGRKTVFLLTDLAWAVVNVGLSCLLIQRFGAVGAGIAFFASYLFHAMMIYPIVRAMSGFRWTGAVLRCAIVQAGFVATSFVAAQMLGNATAAIVGIVILLGSVAYSVWGLSHLVSFAKLPPRVQRLLVMGRLVLRRSNA